MPNKAVIQVPVELRHINRLMVDRVGGELVCHTIYQIADEAGTRIWDQRGRKMTLEPGQKGMLRAFVQSLLPQINTAEGTD